MEIPGIDSILFKTASVTWDSEAKPSVDLIRLIDAIPGKLDAGNFDDVVKLLGQIARFALEPSQEMRVLFLKGRLLSDMQDYAQAYQMYEKSLDVAEQHADLDSQITLTDLAGLMMYGLTRFREAVAYYQKALALWHKRKTQIPEPRPDPEIHFGGRIGIAQWHVGDFDDARAMLARVLTLALYKSGVPPTSYLYTATGDSLWSLALVLRSQSDMHDGGVGYLHTALRRMKRAITCFEHVGTDAVNMGRLHIQIAEIYLDLAEIHLLRGVRESARPMRLEALNYVQSAASYLNPSEDAAGKLLAQLTLLRHAITRRLDRDAALELREFEEELLHVEREAARIGDAIISAKAATLRGEWLLWLGDPDSARAALLLALAGFQSNGMGMATRAQRLLRRANPPE